MLPITFRRKLSLADPPDIRIYGQRVLAVPEISYLGVKWDSGLTFHSHFKSRKMEMDSFTYKISCIAGKWFSRQPQLLKKMYKGAMEPKLLYGHGAWGHRLKLKSFCTFLNMVQRRPLLAIARAYRTVSTDALQVLTGLPPLDLKAIEMYSRFLILRANQSVTVHSQEFDPGDYVSYVSPYETHPAFNEGISFDLLEPTGNGLEIFSDGSGLNDRIGSAMVVLYFGQQIHSERRRMSDHCTVYQAELIGLKLALEFCLTLTTTRVVNIYSDSRSSLQSLADPSNTHPLVVEVRKLCRKAKAERRVQLHWVKAHVGYFGNELADAEAKAASELENVDIEYQMSQKSLKTELNVLTVQAWQDRWDLSEKGRTTSLFLPLVNTRRHLWGDVVELLSGHGRFPAYLYRFGIVDDDLCSCGEVGDGDHYLLRCPLTSSLRARLRFVPSNRSTMVSKYNLSILCQMARQVRTFLPHISR
ncbi:uncharacterized protein LOC129987789 [Argiope bruennichi]|uniref:uncharacterized protein LOC129987789 n=1 Tax=Argiope bruennichi TaxID=94029 RepID=UPI002495A2CF|nr:uncharacterized protein LOC129987789 [Argiope bruennichi]